MRNSLTSATVAMAALLFVTTATSGAYAQSGGASPEMRQACGADAHSLCSGVMPGGDRIKQCMIDNYAKLSDGCKAAMKAAQMTPK